jgi:uncharacterized membrane protein HdeD (DUF308 family)
MKDLFYMTTRFLGTIWLLIIGAMWLVISYTHANTGGEAWKAVVSLCLGISTLYAAAGIAYFYFKHGKDYQ